MSSKKKAGKKEETSVWNKKNAVIQLALVLVAFVGAYIYWMVSQ